MELERPELVNSVLLNILKKNKEFKFEEEV